MGVCGDGARVLAPVDRASALLHNVRRGQRSEYPGTGFGLVPLSYPCHAGIERIGVCRHAADAL